MPSRQQPATTSGGSGRGSTFSSEKAGGSKAKFYQQYGVYPSQHSGKELYQFVPYLNVCGLCMLFCFHV